MDIEKGDGTTMSDNEFNEFVNNQYKDPKDKAENKQPYNVISNNTFTRVNWDGKAIAAVNDVAKALLNLTELFKGQNIQINSLLHVNEPVLPRSNTTATIVEKS